MKTKQIISLCSFCFLLFLSGCTNSTESVDVIYFTGTEDSNTVIIAADGATAMGMTVTATDIVSADIKVNVQIRHELVAELNKKTGKSYVALPEGISSLSADNMMIRSGKYMSEQIKLEIAASSEIEGGINYCVPVSITSIEGSDMSVLEASRTLYVVVQKPIATRAMDFNNSAYFQVPSFMNNPDVKELSAVTLECRVMAKSFQTRNPFISSIMGIEEKFLLRFGDVSIDNDQLMLAGGEVTGAGQYQLAADFRFTTNRWYHIAAVYTGKSMELYIDGKRAASTEAFQGFIDFTFDWQEGFHLGRSASDFRRLNGCISEARVWSVARTGAQLSENMCTVDPTTPGLLAYWRLDAIDGDNVADLTGHGHTAVRKAGSFNWVNIKCPE